MLPALLWAASAQVQPVTTDQDYRETLQMLGIASMRPGADGWNPQAPNAANTDEAKAMVWGPIPPLMEGPVSRKGWEAQRARLFEEFDRSFYGRVPPGIPKVSWTRGEAEKGEEFGIAVEKKSLIGVVRSPSDPSREARIPVTLVVPSNSKGRVPLILSFGFAPARAGAPAGPPWMKQTLEKGFGYAVIVPTSFQADSGAGLRSGMIGLMNRGSLRRPDEWGALRAWAWGAGQARAALAREPRVDGRRIAIEGLSRYGKAALVTMAYEKGFAAALVGSSGAGGAKLWRRDFGERETNVASSGEYHWMAPNFLRYGGPLTPRDMPVDQHQFLALCAPRPVFVGSGSPKVEGTWVDARGMFESTRLASPAWEAYGFRGTSGEEMPPEDQGLLKGRLAWSQHSGGHTNGPNWPFFLDWLERVAFKSEPQQK